MSEFQLYELVAVDTKLTRDDQAELRAISSRADISSRRFRNIYNWGDLKADPTKMLERWFDVLLHYANFGDATVGIRLPAGAVDHEQLEACTDGQLFEWRMLPEHDVLIWRIDPDTEPGDFAEGLDDWIGDLVSLRAELIAGDLRALYLGWLHGWGLWGRSELLDTHADRLDEVAADLDAILEPAPGGKLAWSDLTDGLRTLATAIELDADLLEAAVVRPRERPQRTLRDVLVAANLWPDQPLQSATRDALTATDEARETRISNEYVVDCYDEFEARTGWWSALDQQLEFPFRARGLHTRRSSPIAPDDEVTVIGLADQNECFGEMLVRVEHGERHLAVPLEQLGCIDATAQTVQAVDDWRYAVIHQRTW